MLEVFCSLIGWSSLYLFFCWTFPQQDAEWKCRLVTLSHGVVIVPLTAYVVFIDGPWPLTHAGQKLLSVQITNEWHVFLIGLAIIGQVKTHST